MKKTKTLVQPCISSETILQIAEKNEGHCSEKSFG